MELPKISIYRLMPKFYKKRISEWIIFSGSKKNPEGFVNYSFAISLAIATVVALLVIPYFIYIWIFIFTGMFFLFHGFLILAIDKRTKFVEKILPDALQLIAANLKSGFIPSRAIMLSARKEFGPLSEAIKDVGKEAMTGRPLQDALEDITKTIKSDVLETTTKLVIRGIRAGGQLVSLFEETALDIRRRDAIKNEVRANILMYGIFIAFAGCIGAPVLYALSSFLVNTISKLGAMTGASAEITSRMPIKMQFGMEVTPEFLMAFSVIAILITTIFGSLILGLIGSGSEKAGIKYIPILIIASLMIFLGTGLLINSIFMTLIPV